MSDRSPAPRAAERSAWLRETVRRDLRKRGAVVQTSGGIDSAVTLALAVHAFGPTHTIALYLPDDQSDPESLRYAQAAAAHAGVPLRIEDISAVIGARAADALEIVTKYFPDFEPESDGYAVNVDQDALRCLGIPRYRIAVGPRHKQPRASKPIGASDLQVLLSIQNRKQRYRMLCAYEIAERRGYAVVGASNGDELDTGFVVKYGDDAADVCPIGDLPKSSVYHLASELRVPDEIVRRTPTTDTFGLSQSQSEYYYGESAEALRMLLSDQESPSAAGPAVANLVASLRPQLHYIQTRSVRFPSRQMPLHE